MRRNTFNILATFLLINSCNLELLKKNIDDNKPDDSNGELNSIESLWFETDAAPGQNIQLSDIPEGDYTVKKIITSYEDKGKDKFKSVFAHEAKKDGSFNEGDKINRAVDFSKVDLEKKELFPAVEVNLPLAIRSLKKEVSFFNKHYYWNQNRSNGGWSWRLSGGLSPKGDQFYKIFESTKYKDGKYTSRESSLKRTLIIKQHNDELIISVENLIDDVTKKFRITYIKAPLNSIKNMNEIKTTTDDGAKLKEKKLLTELDTKTILPYVGIYSTDVMQNIDYLAITPNKELIGLVSKDQVLKIKYRGLSGSEKLILTRYDNDSINAHLNGVMFDLKKMTKENAPHENAKLTLDLFDSAIALQKIVDKDGFVVDFSFLSVNYQSDIDKDFTSNQLKLIGYLGKNWGELKEKINTHVIKYEAWAHAADETTTDKSAVKKIVIDNNDAEDRHDILSSTIVTVNGETELQYNIYIPTNMDLLGDTFKTLLNEGLDSGFEIEDEG